MSEQKRNLDSARVASPILEENGDATRNVSHFSQALIESSEDAIICKDMRGQITVWNAAAELMFGHLAQDMVGAPIHVIIPGDRRDEDTLIFNKILAGEKVEHFETVRLHRDGYLIDVSITISPIRDCAGRIIGASNIARDIGKQKALFLNIKHFESIIASSDDAIISKSLDGTILSWNAGAEAMFGFSASEMIGQSMYKLLPPGEQAEEDDILRKLRAGYKIKYFETVRRRKDGRLVNVSVSTSPIRDARGQIIGASKIARDISEQKRVEARLQLTAQVFSSTHEGIVIADADGLIVEVNESFERISGYAREELIGQSPRMFHSSRQGPEALAMMLATLKRNGSFQGEVWSRRKDGQAYASLLSVNVILDASGHLQNYVALVADITPLRSKQEELERLLQFDPLTKLANRLLLADRLQQAMLLARRNNKSVAVLYLDLNRFKQINDMHGHDIGDQVLVAVSRNMLAAIRDTDTLARMGGDEFVLVLQDVGVDRCSDELIDRILRACAQPIVINDLLLQVSASIGVTLFPTDGAEADQLIRHADQAMFVAKREGRNRVYRFDPALEAGIQLRNAQLSRIARAIDTGELCLFFQPKVNMRQGTVIGMEALVRWQHPERGVLPPSEFLPILQDDPMEKALGEQVILLALSQMSLWQAAGMRMPVSVNIAASHLEMPDFAERLETLLQRYPEVNPGDLELEILETSALHDLASVSAVMQACHSLGVHFAIDDFGTGYSALTYLRHLPARMLKIDQSFVRTMLGDKDDSAIVQSVIALAGVFQRGVIAEGVESVEIGERLLDLGCDVAQGYVIARPMPAKEVGAWLACWKPFVSWKTRP